MRTTITLNDEAVARAQAATGIEDRTTLLHAALDALVRVTAAQRLIALGGSDAAAKLPPRRRVAVK